MSPPEPRLWTDTDVADFLQIDLAQVQVAATVVVAAVVHLGPLGRRWNPKRLRSWVNLGGDVRAALTTAVHKPKLPTRGLGSGSRAR